MTATQPTSSARSGISRLLPEPGPARVLAAATGVGSLGYGLYTAGSAVYYVESVGLSATQVGSGLSVAGLLGLVLGVPLGQLADRVGPRAVAIGSLLAMVLPLFAAAFVRDFWTFLAVVTVLGAAEAGWNVSNEALITAVMGSDGRVRVAAYLRAVFNAGFTLAAFAAGLALAADSRPAYLALIWGNAVTALITAGLYLRLPAPPGRARAGTSQSRRSALRDLPYLAVAQVSSVSLLGNTLLFVGLPLWLVGHTEAPRALAGWLAGLNTVLVVALQVRAARGTESAAEAIRVQRWALLAFAGCCVLAGLSGWSPYWPAVTASVLLVLATVALTAGEIWGQAARWSLRYRLAPPEAQGVYGGVFRLGQALPVTVGPVLVTGLTSAMGLTGWLVLAGIFLAALLVSGPVISWAERSRPF